MPALVIARGLHKRREKRLQDLLRFVEPGAQSANPALLDSHAPKDGLCAVGARGAGGRCHLVRSPADRSSRTQFLIEGKPDLVAERGEPGRHAVARMPPASVAVLPKLPVAIDGALAARIISR